MVNFQTELIGEPIAVAYQGRISGLRSEHFAVIATPSLIGILYPCICEHGDNKEPNLLLLLMNITSISIINWFENDYNVYFNY